MDYTAEMSPVFYLKTYGADGMTKVHLRMEPQIDCKNISLDKIMAKGVTQYVVLDKIFTNHEYNWSILYYIRCRMKLNR